ncbi:response regulator transcription factor [Lysinibacillus sp. NPDC059133]|uniref:response regulator transcription factor n=1 Tax=Lysinibacillus sp. NPDC059133 TaxID=3346737 RepID=UPI0036BCE17A
MILGLLAEGYDNKKIGSLLFLSEHTVRDYVSSLMTKLKAKNHTQVVASAFRLGLLNEVFKICEKSEFFCGRKFKEMLLNVQ